MTDRDRIILEIAANIVGVETLETRKRDSLDFHDISVMSLKKALEAAFDAGVQEGAMIGQAGGAE